MKTLLSFCMLLISCTKETNAPARLIPLSNEQLIISGSLDLQTAKANIASLGVLNNRSSYELCGTSGSDLLWPVILPLADSAVYPSSVLSEGDSLSAEIFLDTSLKKNYNITLIIKEDNVIVNNLTVFSKFSLTRNFVFHAGSKYNVSAVVQ